MNGEKRVRYPKISSDRICTDSRLHLEAYSCTSPLTSRSCAIRVPFAFSGPEVGGPAKPFCGTVRGLLADHYSLGTFDLVHVAGLYDYLAVRVAERLTTRLGAH